MPRSLLLLAAALAPVAAAQQQPIACQEILFSIEHHGPSVGAPGSGGVLMDEGAVLRVPPPGASLLAPPPEVLLVASDLGLAPLPMCSPLPGEGCAVEVDALSSGSDGRVPSGAAPEFHLLVSVDEHARGGYGGGGPGAPSVATEALVHDASSDAFRAQFDQGASVAVPFQTSAHVGVLDGDGDGAPMGAQQGPGLGVVEPNDPAQGIPGAASDAGDNVDALVARREVAGDDTYFSLGGGLVDPLLGVAPVHDSAAHAGVLPGDVLVASAGSFGVYAAAADLGLDRLAPAVDDVDALLVGENGTPGYQPTTRPFGWETDGTDMLVFSVRRGSAVVGTVDSAFGVPIEPGDLLVPPYSGAAGTPPAILVPAERLGLATARQTGVAFGDDLDAAGVVRKPMFDCNGNNVEDRIDIANGTSTDVNGNGIPDECEVDGVSFCFCPTGAAPGCDAGSAYGGCENVSGGHGVLHAVGSSDVVADDLSFHVSGLTPSAASILVMGDSQIGPIQFFNGLLCVGGSTLVRYNDPMFVGVADAGGRASYGPGLLSWAANTPQVGVQVVPGSTWWFQVVYRDIGGPCGGAANSTNARSVVFQ